MQFISTRENAPKQTASDAIMRGLAPDGGLYVPESFPKLSQDVYNTMLSYPELAAKVISPFFAGDPLESYIPEICAEAFNFPVPMHWYDNQRAVLELYHGPTVAFKDFGARFLAGVMEKNLKLLNRSLTILVATSGDTGGAVASAFHGKAGIQVKVLFPDGRVSARQEQQLTCWGDNVDAFAVSGVFDDCQKMVKTAFMDKELSEKWGLSSANSINLGRLLPQSVYYVYASLHYKEKTGKAPTFIIPSGNVGNSVGAYWAMKMGAPIDKIILAVNANKTIPDFLATGNYSPRPSIATLANAMDVGDPSNMERLRHLYPNMENLRSVVQAFSVSDADIADTIKYVWEKYQYEVCPHTAAGEWVRKEHYPEESAIVVSTAHPAKFESIVEPLVQHEIVVPESLATLFEKKPLVKKIPADYHLIF